MKSRKIPAGTMALFAAAIGLLLFTTIGGARAALTYYSDTYTSQFNMRHIGITINENGKAVSSRNYNVNQGDSLEDNWVQSSGELLANMLEDAGDAQLVLGKSYPEKLSVTNTSSDAVENGIAEYVRVTVRKYWVDSNDEEVTGDKNVELLPEHIELNFTPVDGWMIDTEYTTKERTVLYYAYPLEVNETTPDFTDTLVISKDIPYTVEQASVTDGDGYTTITTTYRYDGYKFIIEAEADGVQTHNAEAAIMSAWGRKVTISADGTLSLK